MPVLKNPKHELFAQEVAQGKTVTEAYVLAGYRHNDGNASKLNTRPEIQDRIKEITGKAALRAEITIAKVLAELEEARSLAIRIEQPAPAVSASMGKAKVAGLLIEKQEHSGPDGGPIETKALDDFEVAKRLAFLLAQGVRKGESA